VNGDGEGQTLFNAVTGDEIFRRKQQRIGFAAMLDYGRKTGNPGIAQNDFSGKEEKMLKALDLHLRNLLDQILYNKLLYPVQRKLTAGIDIEGGIW